VRAYYAGGLWYGNWGWVTTRRATPSGWQARYHDQAWRRTDVRLPV